MKTEAVWITPEGAENTIATVRPGESTGFANYASGSCEVMVVTMSEAGDSAAVFATSPFNGDTIEDLRPGDTTNLFGEIHPGEVLFTEYEDVDRRAGTLLVRSLVES